MQYLTNLNLSGNELQNARLQNLATAPSTPTAGLIYFDTAYKVTKYYDGTQWVTLTMGDVYTFNTGTTNGAFKVTSSGGTEQIVSIYGLNNAAYKNVDDTISSGSVSTNVVTSKAVADFVSAQMSATDAMRYKGTLGTGGTVTTLPTSAKLGDTYKVITAGTYAAQAADVGDIFIALTNSPAASTAGWSLVPSGDDGTVSGADLTSNTVILGNGGTAIKSLSNGSNGQVLKLVSGVPTWSTDDNTTYAASDGITLNGTTFKHSNSITAGIISDGGSSRTLAFGGTFKIPSVTYDSQGHITSTSTITLTMPSDPTASSVAKKYTTTNPALTVSSGVCTWTVTHSLGNQYPTVSLYEVSSGAMVIAEVTATSTSVLSVSFVSSSNISAGTYRIAVVG